MCYILVFIISAFLDMDIQKWKKKKNRFETFASAYLFYDITVLYCEVEEVKMVYRF
jgi:hypothetical protein